MSVRALVVSNMQASPGDPGRGSFVRDQVRALRALAGLDVELYEFPPGASAYGRAAMELARHHRRRPPDIVHAHFGLTLWPAGVVPAPRAVTLHGTDLTHPRTRRLTALALHWAQLVATVSEPLALRLPPAARGARQAVLPCGVSLERFGPLERGECRRRLGLDPRGRYVLFPADPARPAKRVDLARELAGLADARLLTLGQVAPADVPLWVNAAHAVIVPSDAEGFGLGVLEALACDVPVLARPVGIHPQALEGIDGTLCAPYDAGRWRAALEPHLDQADPRVRGRDRAEQFSAARMAARVATEWAALLG
ncbi:MAG TPA: glycosyltransferase [Solirubrobacteraceae bacterium]|nr:glycosyltransferase [Solirubrobacteraceae bacterium]